MSTEYFQPLLATYQMGMGNKKTNKKKNWARQGIMNKLPKESIKTDFTHLCPGFDWQFSDLNGCRVNDGHLSIIHILILCQFINGAFEPLIAWQLDINGRNEYVNQFWFRTICIIKRTMHGN